MNDGDKKKKKYFTATTRHGCEFEIKPKTNFCHCLLSEIWKENIDWHLYIS